MNGLKTFEHPMFGNIRVVIQNEELAFNLYDTAFALGYTRPNANNVHYLRKDKLVNICESLDISGVTPGVTDIEISLETDFENTYIKESDLYELALESKAKNARPFRKWITTEVVPSIRKHGAYMTPQTIDNIISDPDFGIKLLMTLKEEQSKRKEAEQAAIEANHIIKKQKPKVIYAEAVEISEDTVLVKDLAMVLKQKGVNIGEIRLFKWLRDNGYLCKQKGEMWNMPTQRSLDLEIIVVKHGLRTGNNGEMKKTRTPKITGKGQVYFVNKILKEAGILAI